MDQGAVQTHEGPADARLTSAAPPNAQRAPRLGADLTVLILVGALLLAAVGAGVISLYREFYSPTAFVERYLGMLAEGRAADALGVAGVAVDPDSLADAGLPESVSDALLRRATLAPLTDIRSVREETSGAITRVTVDYVAGSYPGTSTFEIERDGWIGVTPSWRFATSPLAVMELTVRGSMRFTVNGFEVDKRQVSPDGVDADPLDPLALLVFSPGLYAVSVDTAISATPGVNMLSDVPQALVPLDLQAEPTEQFIEVVQQRVDEFLAACTTQQVLQPTACPFGFVVENRIEGLPVWTMGEDPKVAVAPDGDNWKIPPADAVAHIEVDIRSLFDGSLTHVSEDVPFIVNGTITVLPDGSASISVGAP